jgi:radical SAM protein with 4Fe4S-binding SPASM domain
VRAGLAPRISLFLTEMRHNLREIPALLEFADNLGIPSVATGTLVAGGRAAQDSLISPPETEQYLRLLERYNRDQSFSGLYERIGNVAVLEWRKSNAHRTECCTFVENPYLSPQGRLYPCSMCRSDEHAVPGVFDKPLAAAFAEGVRIWSFLIGMSRQRCETLRKCRDCSERLACAGGCMGRAWGSCGDLLAADDRCGVT